MSDLPPSELPLDLQATEPGTIRAIAVPPPAPAILIEGYDMLRPLNKGGQAHVLLAIQKSTGRRVAIKILSQGRWADERERARFDREIQVLGTLNHPGVVTVIDRGNTADGATFLVMDYIDGLPLDDYIREARKNKEWEEAEPGVTLRLFMKIADAVNAAHLCGITHRDLKPANILVDDRGEPHIVDFGLAHLAVTPADPDRMRPVTITGEFIGSLPWASPEQAEGIASKIDIRSDVYSLGVVLYQMLTSAFPYEVVGTMRDVLNNILTKAPTPPSQILADRERRQAGVRAHRLKRHHQINEEIEAMVLKALAKRRDDRYQSAGEFARDVASYLSGKPTTAGGIAATRRRARRRNRLLVATAVILLVLGGVGWVVLRPWIERQRQAGPRVATTQRPETGVAGEVGEQWVQLFNGKDLKGWRKPGEQAPSGNWGVEEGCLTLLQSKRIDLVTANPFEDFELILEWKIAPGGNSGIFYRVPKTAERQPVGKSPEYQITDPQHRDIGGQKSKLSGAIFGALAVNRDAAKPIGEWNSTRIAVEQKHVKHWLNGELVMEGSLPERLNQCTEAGLIVLQDYSERVWFRDIRVRRLRPGTAPSTGAVTQRLTQPAAVTTTRPSCEFGRFDEIRIENPHPGQGHDKSMAVSPDFTLMATSCRGDPHLRVWSLADQKEQFTLPADDGYYRHLEFSPDGKVLLGATDDPSYPRLRAWDISARKLVANWSGTGFKVRDISSSLEGRRVLVRPHFKEARLNDPAIRIVRVWDWAGQGRCLEFDAGAGCTHVAISPDGKRLLTVPQYQDDDKAPTKLWDVDAGSVLLRTRTRGRGGCFLPNSTQLALVGENSKAKQAEIIVVDGDSAREIRRFLVNYPSSSVLNVPGLTASDSRQLLVSLTGDGDTKVTLLIDLGSGQELKRLGTFGEHIARSADGRLVFLSGNRGMHFWDLESGLESSRPMKSGNFSRVYLSPDDSMAHMLDWGSEMSVGVLRVPPPTAIRTRSASTNARWLKEVLSDAERKAGWRELAPTEFSILAPEEWRLPGGVKLRDGDTRNWWWTAGHIRAVSGQGTIVTRELFDDFEFSFEWCVSQGAGCGVILRAANDDKVPANTGLEIRLCDEVGHPEGKELLTTTGAIAHVKPPVGRELTLPPGWYNRTVIICQGDNIEVWINDKLANRIEIGSAEWQKLIAASPMAGSGRYAKEKSGHIGLAAQGGGVWFREIKVRPLPAGTDPLSRPATQPSTQPESRPVTRKPDPAKPFVLLRDGGKDRREMAHFNEAIAVLKRGDIVEVHGNGPFEIGMVRVDALDLRAAPGYLV